MRWKTAAALFTVLAFLLILSGCPGPVYESARLRAVKSESERLMETHAPDPVERWAEVPQSEWPPAIASLRPEMVILRPRQVHIIIKPFFDGGWGYEIPRREEDLGMLPECYQDLGHGIFWHGPC